MLQFAGHIFVWISYTVGNIYFTYQPHLILQAKFLKACGTLVETPVEIRKASSKLNGSPHHDRGSEPPKFNSWLPNTSIKQLQQEDQPDQPLTPIKLGEEWGKGSRRSEHTPSRFYIECLKINRFAICRWLGRSFAKP